MVATTALYDWHKKLEAKFAIFAGVNLPLCYSKGMLAEHLHTRKAASLFDVSHLPQVAVRGKNAAQALELLFAADLLDMPCDRWRYCLMLNEDGGIIDDVMIGRRAEDEFWLILNASRCAVDLKHIRKHLPKEISTEHHHSLSLLSLQGPSAAMVLSSWYPQINDLAYMSASTVTIDGVSCYISRLGYTGEDGFELSVASKDVMNVAESLSLNPEVGVAGLAARNSLRLEAGLCLYGNELTEDVTPAAAGLVWTIAKIRSSQGTRAGGFIGEHAVKALDVKTVERRLIACRSAGRIPAREGAVLLNKEKGEVIGEVSSGCYSPSLKTPIAFAFIDTDYADAGTKISTCIRQHHETWHVVTPPFIPHRYHKI